MEKPNGYYSFLRSDVLPYFPNDAKTFLSLGCGAAATEGQYRLTHDCHITGIELNPEAAKEAQKKIDHVITGDLMSAFQHLKDNSFDCILALDVLEHLDNPWLALNQYASLLSPKGVFIASIPNINHRTVRAFLQEDRFPYVPAGILDYTHKRFFTLTEIYRLFACAGLKITYVKPHSDRASSIQYIVIARPAKVNHPKPLASIIIPTLNNLAYTRQCIDSLRRNTRTAYQTIVVDNGSSDGTREWLEKQKDIIHIPNISNLGFAVAINQALQYIDTPYVVLANNDILLTPDWLQHMINHMEKDPSVGLVGPVSNYVSGPQLLESLGPVNQASADNFSKLSYEAKKGTSREFIRLVFFCVLIKLPVLEKIGFLDERFTLGMFEDDDFCIRSGRAGYKLLIADDVFIPHYGSRTFRNEKMNFNATLAQNQKLFLDKWGVKLE